MVGSMGTDFGQRDASVHAIVNEGQFHPAVRTAALMGANPRDANNASYLTHGARQWTWLIEKGVQAVGRVQGV